MKAGIERGDIKCVIVKDLSRFGRNAALMTIELERFNDDYGLRFISITEDIDATSTNDYNEVFQIVLVLNEMYPRDCSKKIKASWHNGVTSGKFMFGTPPYGYQRGTNDALRLEVDPVAAKVLKRIFAMYSSGDSMRQIADTLNSEHILCPSAYYYDKKGKANPKADSATWSGNTIRQMLDNETYRGVLIQGKRRAVSYKNKKRKMVAEDNWYRTENAHEALVDEFTWEIARTRRREKSQTRQHGNKQVGVFSSLLRCGSCGAALSYTRYRSKAIYRCSHYNNNGRTACTPHSIGEDELIRVVTQDIQKYACLAHHERNALIQSIWQRLNSDKSESDKILLTRKKKLQIQMDTNESATKMLFEDRAKGYVPDNIFHTQIKHFSEELETLKKDLQEIQHKTRQKRSAEGNINQWLGKIEQQLDLSKIDRAVATELIEHILVYEVPLGDGKRGFELLINYRFVGNLDEVKKDTAC